MSQSAGYPIQLYGYGPLDGKTFEVSANLHGRGVLEVPVADLPTLASYPDTSLCGYSRKVFRWDGTVNEGGFARYRLEAR